MNSPNRIKYPLWPICIEYVAQQQYKLMHDWYYVTDSKLTIKVPAGFVCDGASIPRIAWSIIGAPFDYIEAAILHDYIYQQGPRIYPQISGLIEYVEIIGDPYSWHNQGVLRQWTDSMYQAALRDMGVSRRNRVAQYRAVRWWGWWPWYLHRRQDNRVVGSIEPVTPRPDMAESEACA